MTQCCMSGEAKKFTRASFRRRVLPLTLLTIGCALAVHYDINIAIIKTAVASYRNPVFSLTRLRNWTTAASSLVSKGPTTNDTDATDFTAFSNNQSSLRRRLPQFLIIGMKKAGTRALLEFLDRHPSIEAQRRELNFFNQDANFRRGFEYYKSLMPPTNSNQLTTEKTPAYFLNKLVPDRVRRMNSSIRFLIVVRDPITRAVSDYLQYKDLFVSQGGSGSSYLDFEQLVINSKTGKVNQSYAAIYKSIYHLHMSRWLKVFPIQQFHFVDGENFVRNPFQELRNVETFLGIDHFFNKDQFIFDRERRFYCLKLTTVKTCMGANKGRTHPRISKIVTSKLRAFFRPHNVRFYRMIGRDFGWSSGYQEGRPDTIRARLNF